MVARELAYNIVVGAVQQANVDTVFGGINKSIGMTKRVLNEALDRQKMLNVEIRKAKSAGEDYDDLIEQLKVADGEVKDLTGQLSRQQDELREGEIQVNKYGSRMKWAIGIVTLMTGALTALVAVQGQQSRSLINVERLTGLSAQTLDQMNNAAMRITGQGFAPETWLGITDNFLQMNEQIRLGNDLSDEQYLAYQRLRVNPFQAATLGAQDWYEALQKVPEPIRAITAQQVGITGLYNAFRPAIDRQESWNETVGASVSLSQKAHEEFAVARMELDELGQSFKDAGVEAASSFVPILKDAYETLTPFVKTVGTFIEQNPRVVKALAAIGIGLAAVSTALWIANVAAAFFATVSGVGIPLVITAGVAAAAVAVAGGVAFAGLGGFGGSNAISAVTGGNNEQLGADEDNTDRVVGAVGQSADRQLAVFEKSRQELNPILRVLECSTRDNEKQFEQIESQAKNVEAINKVLEAASVGDPTIFGGFRSRETEGGGRAPNRIYAPRTPFGYLNDAIIGAGSLKPPEAGQFGSATDLHRDVFGSMDSLKDFAFPNGFQGGFGEEFKKAVAEAKGDTYEVTITNNFDNNPVPVETAVTDFFNEVQRLNARD